MDSFTHLIGLVGGLDDHADRLEHLGRCLSHRNLRRIEFAVIAAHGHQHEEGKLASDRKAQHVDAVTNPRTLHEKHSAHAAKPGTREQRHPFLFGTQANDAHRRIGFTTLDKRSVTRVWHKCNQPDRLFNEQGMHIARPVVAALSLRFPVFGAFSLPVCHLASGRLGFQRSAF